MGLEGTGICKQIDTSFFNYEIHFSQKHFVLDKCFPAIFAFTFETHAFNISCMICCIRYRKGCNPLRFLCTLSRPN